MIRKIRKVMAPFTIGVLFLGFTFAPDVPKVEASSFHWAASAAISVALAYLIWPSSITTVGLVMVIVSIAFPFAILYAMGNYGKLAIPASEIAAHIEWPSFVAPLLAALGTSFVLQHLTRRWRGTRRKTPRPSA